MQRKIPRACGNPECRVSSGIHECLTFGSGDLSELGFWENPCGVCARAYEKDHPGEKAWPHKEEDLQDSNPITTEDVEGQMERLANDLHGEMGNTRDALSPSEKELFDGLTQGRDSCPSPNQKKEDTP